MPRFSRLRGDESQYEAWLKGLTKEEREEHEREQQRLIDEANSRPHPTVKRGAVRGVCGRCGAPVMEGESFFAWNEECHKGCGGKLLPTKLQAKSTETTPMKYSANVPNGLVLKMWETRNGGARVQFITANSTDTIIVTKEQRSSFANAMDLACATLRAWSNGKPND